MSNLVVHWAQTSITGNPVTSPAVKFGSLSWLKIPPLLVSSFLFLNSRKQIFRPMFPVYIPRKVGLEKSFNDEV